MVHRPADEGALQALLEDGVDQLARRARPQHEVDLGMRCRRRWRAHGDSRIATVVSSVPIVERAARRAVVGHHAARVVQQVAEAGGVAASRRVPAGVSVTPRLWRSKSGVPSSSSSARTRAVTFDCTVCSSAAARLIAAEPRDRLEDPEIGRVHGQASAARAELRRRRGRRCRASSARRPSPRARS